MKETLSVPDVSCGHCKETIEAALTPLEGVRAAVVDIDLRSVAVDYDPAVLPREHVLRIIEATGYTVAV